MICKNIQWYVRIYNDMQGYTMVCKNIPTMMCKDIQKYTMMCKDIQWYVKIYNDM